MPDKIEKLTGNPENAACRLSQIDNFSDNKLGKNKEQKIASAADGRKDANTDT